MPPIKIEAGLKEDDQYRHVPGLGQVRTGPRGNEYWHARKRESSSSSYSVSRGYDSYRPGRFNSSCSVFNPFYDSYRPIKPHSSNPSFHSRSGSEDNKNKHDTYSFSNHNQILNDMFATAQRNKSRDRLHDDRVFDFRDSRRSHFLSSQSRDHNNSFRDAPRSSSQSSNRSIKLEPGDHESHLFFRGNTLPSSVDVETDEFDGEPMSDSSRQSESEPSEPEARENDGEAISDHGSESVPAPLPPPTAHTRIAGNCRCPINLDCPARADHLIDCRTLVIEWEKWKWSQAQGVVEEMPADVDAADEPFVTVEEASRIVQLVHNITQGTARTLQMRTAFNQLSLWITLMNTQSINETDLTVSNAFPTIRSFLSVENAPLRRSKHVPAHIEEELLILLRKWSRGDYSQLPSRGLTRTSRRAPFHPDPEWPYRCSAKFFGHGSFVNGQKWGRRAEMARDGIHGPLIAGISGGKKTGAYSVVMGYHDTYRHDYYADIDCGNRIFYLSTALAPPARTLNIVTGQVTSHEPSNYKDGPEVEPPNDDDDEIQCTSGAMALKKSFETGFPVRVIRSFRASEICPHRPKKGYRYDGLYEVVDSECLKAERGIWRFEMTRLPEINRQRLEAPEYITDGPTGGRGGNAPGAGGTGAGEERNTGPIRSGVPAEAVHDGTARAGARRMRRREATRATGRR